jgi:pentachlorophenol monooxygenase/3-(3-hydroxy-phenyl)propionate hydroxylase
VGVLLPDAPITDPASGSPTRLRLLARTGFTLLVHGGDGDVAGAHAAAAGLPGPLRVEALDVLSPEVDLAEALGSRPGEVWVVRPDAHVAAVVPAGRPADLRAALERALGLP